MRTPIHIPMPATRAPQTSSPSHSCSCCPTSSSAPVPPAFHHSSSCPAARVSSSCQRFTGHLIPLHLKYSNDTGNRGAVLVILQPVRSVSLIPFACCCCCCCRRCACRPRRVLLPHAACLPAHVSCDASLSHVLESGSPSSRFSSQRCRVCENEGGGKEA